MGILWKLLGKRKWLALGAVGLSAACLAVTFWWNAQLSAIINKVSIGVAPGGEMLTLALATMGAMCLVNYGKGIVSSLACEYMAHDLRMGYARHLSSLSFEEAEKQSAGEALSLLQNEVSGVASYISDSLFGLLDDSLVFLSTFGFLLTLQPFLTLASNLPVFLILIYVVWSSKAIKGATVLSQQAKGEMNRFADTLLRLFPIVRLFDASAYLTKDYEKAVAAWETQSIKAERIRARLMSLSALLSRLPLLLLFLVGGTMAISGRLSIGVLYIFLNLSGNVSGSLMNRPAYISAFRSFLANLQRLEGKLCLSSSRA